MADKMVFYHNPRCSKSRSALEILLKKGIQPEVVEYLKWPLSEEDLLVLMDQLGDDMSSMVRTGEVEYDKSRLGKGSEKHEVARALAKYPILLERPVFVVNNKAVIGRPPEKVLQLVP